MSQLTTQNDGYILVASDKHAFYQMACYCAETLKDYYPDANVTLFTHAEWVDSAADVFDNVITGIPNHKRAKLWALSQSPYDRTMYLDADCSIHHEDISTVFDTLGDDDIKVMKVRPYAAAASKFPAGELIHHMGVFAYKTDTTRDFMDAWYNQYLAQQKEWDLDPDLYPIRLLRPWDIFTFWRLINIDKWDIKVGIWEDDARWNFHGLRESELNGKPMIVFHNHKGAIDYANDKNLSKKQAYN